MAPTGRGFVVALVCVIAAATSARAWGDGNPLAPEIAPNPALVGQKITLTLVLDTDDTRVAADLEGLPAALQLLSGPYIQPNVTFSGTTGTGVRVTFILSGREPGRFVVPAVSLHVGDHEVATLPAIVAVGGQGASGIVVPVVPRWTVGMTGGALYVGQSVGAAVVLENEVSSPVDARAALSTQSAGIEPAPMFAAPSSVQAGADKLYTVPIACFEVTPTSAGFIELPRVSVSAGERSASAAALRLRVLALPPAVSATGAVGNFSFRSWMGEHAVRGGVEIDVHERVEGSGNLPTLTLPDPTAGGLLELSPQETRSISPGFDGYEGFREVVHRYLLASGQTKGQTIVVPRFVWLDPKTGAVSAAAEHVLTIDAASQNAPATSPSGAVPNGTAPASRAAVPASNAAAAPSTGAAPSSGSGPTAASATSADDAGAVESTRNTSEVVGVPPTAVPSPLGAAIVARSRSHERYRNPLLYLVLLPGPLAFTVFAWVRRRRPRRGLTLGAAVFTLLLAGTLHARAGGEDTLSSALNAYDSGDYRRAMELLSDARAEHPADAPLAYDLGLTAIHLARYGEAVHYLRTAVFLSPADGRYRAALDWAIARSGVGEQVPPVYPIHPDVFLIALLLLVNTSAVFGIVAVARRSGLMAIPAILCAALALIAAGGLAYAAVKRAEVTAVVAAPGAELTKIPEKSANPWLKLPEGISVDVRDQAGAYALVQTGYGTAGWVERDRLLVDGVMSGRDSSSSDSGQDRAASGR